MCKWACVCVETQGWQWQSNALHLTHWERINWTQGLVAILATIASLFAQGISCLHLLGAGITSRAPCSPSFYVCSGHQNAVLTLGTVELPTLISSPMFKRKKKICNKFIFQRENSVHLNGIKTSQLINNNKKFIPHLPLEKSSAQSKYTLKPKLRSLVAFIIS